jgi:hypothetical protein
MDGSPRSEVGILRCLEHDWVRAPDRDVLAGYPLIYIEMAFWCRKCAETKRSVLLDRRDTASNPAFVGDEVSA